MLRIEDIHKRYVTGDLVQTALDGVSLTLRDHEFVAILGPSGSGKTTLLNVIGGLDRYDSGNLIINGISTKKYSDRNWDSYRNHTIGFVFQSYNLIPHQTILANVELALTISGVSRSERRKRALKALEDVGLGNQYHKRPNQLSGGQMQRVAIARALVNNPDILLADEPTGALDSDTSVQVMELLKDVSKDRLVVMVTHNPELAQAYASRIVRFRDGKIIDDSDPYTVDDDMDPPMHRNMGKARMTFWTALSLSFNNLRTKKARTFLTAFAGSIGIIGIALILSLSTGFQKYIDKIQEDTLANYPLTLQSETADMASAMGLMGSILSDGENGEPGKVAEQQMLSQMFSQIGTNDLREFKSYLEAHQHEIQDAINTVKYTYNIKPRIYRDDGDLLQVNPSTLFSGFTGNGMMSAYMEMDVFRQMVDNTAMLDAQYDILQGRWPENRNELVIVLPDPYHMPDYMAYTLGLKDGNELKKMMELVMSGMEAEPVGEPLEWTYAELMDLRFRMILPSDLYRYNSEYQVWEDMSGDAAYMRRLVEAGEELHVVGIVCPKDGVSATALQVGIAYTPELTSYAATLASQSSIVAMQLNDPAVDIFTGKPFGEEKQDTKLNFEDMISIDSEMLSSAFGVNMDESAIYKMLERELEKASDSLVAEQKKAQKAFVGTLEKLGTDFLTEYVQNNSDKNGEAILRLTDLPMLLEDYFAGDSAVALIKPLVSKYSLPQESFKQVYSPMMMVMLSGYIAENMPEITLPELPEIPTVPMVENQTEATTEPAIAPEVPIDTEQFYAVVKEENIAPLVSEFGENPLAIGTGAAMSVKMIEDIAKDTVNNRLSGFGTQLMGYFGSSIEIDEEKIANAFHFELDQEELMRLMQALSGTKEERSADANLKALGYADLADPSAISIYLVDFAAKERFLNFLDDYNADMERAGKSEQVIRYTDMTGVMMSSVRTIVDSVSYVLIAFVAVSLLVSSIMIGIITYISVMERTKEIGVLRAIGASKHNISQVFNAETFIIGLCSGLLGVGITLALNIPINRIIHTLTESSEINAQLPPVSGLVLILLSMCLTLIGGLLPAKKAARKDPVIALRTE